MPVVPFTWPCQPSFDGQTGINVNRTPYTQALTILVSQSSVCGIVRSCNSNDLTDTWMVEKGVYKLEDGTGGDSFFGSNI